MEINPPICERTNEQLLKIIETSDQWRPDVVELTQKELLTRGISLETQQTRKKIATRFRERIDMIKGRATYTTFQKVLIVLFGPVLVLILGDILLFNAGEGLKRKNRQGATYLIIGIILWNTIFNVLNTFRF